MRVPVTFRGGSLGGKNDTLHKKDIRNYRVPVVQRPFLGRGFVGDWDTLPPPTIRYAVDEYRYEGERQGDHYVMRWQRPDVEGMASRINGLLNRVEELTDKVNARSPWRIAAGGPPSVWRFIR